MKKNIIELIKIGTIIITVLLVWSVSASFVLGIPWYNPLLGIGLLLLLMVAVASCCIIIVPLTVYVLLLLFGAFAHLITLLITLDDDAW